MVLVRLHTTHVDGVLGAEPRLVVEVQRAVQERIATVDAGEVEVVVAALVARPTDSENDLSARVVEVQLNAQLRVVGLQVEGLILRDEHLKVVGGKALTLGILKEHVGDLHGRLEIRRCQAARRGSILDRNIRRRDDDTVGKLSEVHMQLHAVELKRGEREGIAGVLAVPERERHVHDARLARVAHELRAGVALADELRQPTARLAGQLLPDIEEVVVEGIDGAAADDNLGGLDQVLADAVHPVAPHVAELRAHTVGAVLDVVTAVERRGVAILVLEPLVASRLELRGALGSVGVRDAVVHVLGKGGLVILGAGSARLVHVDRELVARANAGALLLVEVARHNTRNVDADIGVIAKIALAV